MLFHFEVIRALSGGSRQAAAKKRAGKNLGDFGDTFKLCIVLEHSNRVLARLSCI